jgi:hypothetical protein
VLHCFKNALTPAAIAKAMAHFFFSGEFIGATPCNIIQKTPLRALLLGVFRARHLAGGRWCRLLFLKQRNLAGYAKRRKGRKLNFNFSAAFTIASTVVFLTITHELP